MHISAQVFAHVECESVSELYASCPGCSVLWKAIQAPYYLLYDFNDSPTDFFYPSGICTVGELEYFTWNVMEYLC